MKNINELAAFVQEKLEEPNTSSECFSEIGLEWPPDVRYRTNLGRLLATILEWDGEAILNVAQEAMHDANFNGVVQYFESGQPFRFVLGIEANVEMFPKEESFDPEPFLDMPGIDDRPTGE